MGVFIRARKHSPATGDPVSMKTLKTIALAAAIAAPTITVQASTPESGIADSAVSIESSAEVQRGSLDQSERVERVKARIAKRKARIAEHKENKAERGEERKEKRQARIAERKANKSERQAKKAERIQQRKEKREAKIAERKANKSERQANKAERKGPQNLLGRGRVLQLSDYTRGLRG